MTDPRDVRIAQLEGVLRKAVYELNTIRARDGVPWTGVPFPMRTDVCEEYFSSVVDECFAALTPKPDAPPNPAAEPEPINYHRAVEHLSGRIETLEGALRRADDRLAAIHRAYQDGVHPRVNRLVDSLPTLIAEGEKALREEEGS